MSNLKKPNGAKKRAQLIGHVPAAEKLAAVRCARRRKLSLSAFVREAVRLAVLRKAA